MLARIKVEAKWEGYAELPVWRAQHLPQLGDQAKKMCHANQKWQRWTLAGEKKTHSFKGEMENANYQLYEALQH